MKWLRTPVAHTPNLAGWRVQLRKAIVPGTSETPPLGSTEVALEVDVDAGAAK